VCEILEHEYGKPRLGNPADPIDDLIFVMLSNRTGPVVAARTYERLKSKYKTWSDLVGDRLSELIKILEPAGLSNKKSRQILEALTIIQNDFGTIDLQQLKNLASNDVEQYLVTLPGVSLKVAKCIMMYTLGAEVLPVDAHVHRVAGRLGWMKRRRADQCHKELEALVPPHRRFAFHVDCILHGRSACKPRRPSCTDCVINRYCEFYGGVKNA